MTDSTSLRPCDAQRAARCRRGVLNVGSMRPKVSAPTQDGVDLAAFHSRRRWDQWVRRRAREGADAVGQQPVGGGRMHIDARDFEARRARFNRVLALRRMGQSEQPAPDPNGAEARADRLQSEIDLIASRPAGSA
jgi:hypothetical protein